MKDFISNWNPETKSLYKKADAQKVAKEILQLNENKDIIQAEEVVEMARNENTESHKLFEWDDSIAGEKYRIEQARHMLRSLTITYVNTGVEKKKVKEIPIRMLFSLKGETGYRLSPVIIEDKELHKKLLSTARSELEAYMRKYSTLSELQPLVEEIGKFIYEMKIFDV